MYVNGDSVIAIGIIFPVLGILAVTGRFVARIKSAAGIGIDDWFCVPALVIVVVNGFLLIYGSLNKTIGYHSPAGQSLQEVLTDRSKKHTLLLELEVAIDILNPIGTGLIRLSLLFFYRRIFRGRVFDILSWVVITIVIAWILSFTIGMFALCGGHFNTLFASMADIKAKCGNPLLLLGLMGVTGFVIDVVILTMPFFWIWRLQMRTSQKWAVSSVFLVGLFTVATGAMRMVAGILTLQYKWDAPQRTLLGLKTPNDIMGGISLWLFWQYIEHGTGMVVCCMPILRGLCSRQRWTTMTSSQRSRSPLLRVPYQQWIRGRSLGDIDTRSEEREMENKILVTNTVLQYTTPVRSRSESSNEPHR